MPCIGQLISDEHLRFEKDFESDSDTGSIHFELASSPTNFEYCHDESTVPLIQKIKSKIEANERFYSLEFFPPRTKDGAANLLSRMDRMNKGKPLFMDVTWHAGMSSASNTISSSMTIASSAVNYLGIETLLHVTTNKLSKHDLREVLNTARSHGIRNIMALSGDNHSYSDFRYTSEFVAWIRAEFGSCFTIAVAGYPEGHPDSTYEDSLHHLRQKVDAGADFIVTQLLFDIEKYEEFINDCKCYDINVPIIAGILPIQNYDSLRKLKKLASNVRIPRDLQNRIEGLKDDDEAIREVGIEISVDIITELFDRNLANGIHIYTLNREIGPKEVVKQVGLWSKDRSRRPFPWQVTANNKRVANEDVRPVYWAQRPKSYITRTKQWDEFPNGRWGNASNPAFGELDDYHLFYMAKPMNLPRLRNMWGHEIRSVDDIREVFLCFIKGCCNRNGVEVIELPWNYEPLNLESKMIQEQLIRLNENGFFTVNSQPAVNAAPSNDQIFGWGPKNGYIYQKAYLEFFATSEDTKHILELINQYPLLSYTISDISASDW